MENFRNYYDILNINRQAKGDEIKQAFRRLARQYHPDLNPGDQGAEEKFKTLSEAYEVLSDPNKRAKYDQFSLFWKRQESPGGDRGRNPRPGVRQPEADNDFSQFPDFNIFVDDLLGRGPVNPRPGVRSPAAAGAELRSEPRSAPRRTMPRTEGSRIPEPRTQNPRTPEPQNPEPRTQNPRTPEPRTEVRSAPPPLVNRGASPPPPALGYKTGMVKTAYTIRPAAPPRDAEAKLEVPLERAYSGGRERVRLEDGRSIEVDMPGGMVTGQQMRLRGQGIEGGNLYLRVVVTPHPFYRLQGSDLFCVVSISPVEAILGAAIAVPTLDGPVQMKLQPGVRSGQRLRLAAKGYPQPQGRRGDQIVEVQVVIPKTISPEERVLYEEIYGLERDRLHKPLLLG
ncbi:DnaJ C-terminal domain-containing protein [Prochlorothrix hollandica]|uniref:J domain-containing protein n=1 Tax=Prochlorothrix hollandica PCC 9006 = CALU 1027 TaxID=317619 RepID=A0A0M2PXJ4_PROHO|nr:J domain-containing protein [Prochlorothrix hollandica]KKJ01161.1 hypothetical protein PROH_01855 [Prochlorothrix hollandica PCC 9006 = CALU 1027]